jgi:hypothetical protein
MLSRVTTPTFFAQIVGLRGASPNNADSDSKTSVAIARGMLDRVMGGSLPRQALKEEAAGTALEIAVETYVREALLTRDADRKWVVGRRLQVRDFAQYRHLGRLAELVRADETLRVELGSDYIIKPDVTVGVEAPDGSIALHAAISCKWTIRSDRVQNIRHEAHILMRNRRGRQPHIVAVTAEPLPSRLAAIAMGTGEVDAVYHVALTELQDATAEICGPRPRLRAQLTALQLLVSQGRIRDFSELPETLATS